MDISLLIVKDLRIGLVSTRRENHEGFWFVNNDHDGKAKDQCYEAERKYRIPRVRKLS